MRFKDKVAIITAVASGIGRATADIMAAEGAVVVGVDNDQRRLDMTVEALNMSGGRAKGFCIDALNEQEVNEVISHTARDTGIDILVNAVGGSTIIAKPNANVEELSLEDWHRIIAFNLQGSFLFTHAVVPVMKKQKHGKIVNLASIAGRGLSVSSSSAYAAAKGGIIAFTRKLSFELGPFGINVNAIAPSLTLTERIRPHWNQRSPEAQVAQIENTPLRRVAEAADQAKVICFLASSDADFVTGLTIDVTGGQSG
ncbi:MAG: SDR family oxidoreductase [Acetobacteraceae bacterium]|nr:SDR family oxidoreductase [Acetobacteraceae bacterium]